MTSLLILLAVVKSRKFTATSVVGCLDQNKADRNSNRKRGIQLPENAIGLLIFASLSLPLPLPLVNIIRAIYSAKLTTDPVN